MGQRTQLHIKKNSNFYVIHDQWGDGYYMINNVKKIIDAGLFEDADIERLLLPFNAKQGARQEAPYYTLDRGDNNNGVFLLDCDRKSYCFLAGNEDIEYLTIHASFDNKHALNTLQYLNIWGKEYIKDENKEAEGIDKLFKKNGFSLMVNYKWESGYQVSKFIEKSRLFEKKTTTKCYEKNKI